FHPSEGTFLFACRDAVRLRSRDKEQPLVHAIPHCSSVHLAKFSPSGRFVATAGAGGLVRLRFVTPRHPLDYRVPVRTCAARGFLSRDGQLFLLNGTNWRRANMTDTTLFDASTGHPVDKPIVPGGLILDACLSPAGNTVALAISRATTAEERM